MADQTQIAERVQVFARPLLTLDQFRLWVQVLHRTARTGELKFTPHLRIRAGPNTSVNQPSLAGHL